MKAKPGMKANFMVRKGQYSDRVSYMGTTPGGSSSRRETQTRVSRQAAKHAKRKARTNKIGVWELY